ncbi:MAG TPA: hypothetical protein VJL29_04205 [Thermoguttaceae bacterium]|nr:hypothetical protein [Thermoguttaceae bacterium]
MIRLICVASLLFATLAFPWAPAARALEPAGDDSRVVPVSYSTGKCGTRLTWLPYRPTADEVRGQGASTKVERTLDPTVVRTDFNATAKSSNRANDAMADPFNDGAGSGEDHPTPSVENQPFQPEFLDPTALPDKSDTATAQNTLGASQAPESNVPRPMVEQGLGQTAQGSVEPEPLPSLEDVLAQSAPRAEDCPATSDFKPINKLTTDVRASSGDFPQECPIKNATFTPRAWCQTTYTWKASGLCHKPLYFEQIQLERYGHSTGPYTQPLLSHAHFFATIPVLPYLMGVYPPNECMYTLGYYRPGSCAPYMLDPLPISVRGALWEAGAWTGAAYLVP